MRGDFSRITFDPTRHYSGVLLQQGRVQVDADWNEQQQIQAHRTETEALDVVGSSGAPLTSPGFALSFTPGNADLVIGAGRYYIDGILCELDNETPYPFTGNGDANVSISPLRPDLVDLRPGDWIIVEPDGVGAQLLRIVTVGTTASSITLALSASVGVPPAPATPPVTGLLQRVVTYLSQRDYPGGDAGFSSAATPPQLMLTNGTYVVYLDVWRRHVTALDDALLREKALGGPDTTTRLKTVFQVKLLNVTPPPANTLALCGASFPEWDALLASSGGTLVARSQPAGPAGPCLIPPGGGFQGLENQLYRVEIHDPGPLGTATFKWSRDNGSVVTNIRAFNGTSLTVESTGPDDALGFANGQWVEILGDADELHGRPGQLLQIDTVTPTTGTIVLKAAPTPIDPSLHPKLRRWDSAGLQTTAVAATNGGFLPLENGVEVLFGGAGFRSGDYWLIPARSGATADIEWPHALPQGPAGVTHHLARLGVIQIPIVNPILPIQDCRPTFAPLTTKPRALHIQNINWLNDDVLTVSQLITSGLQLTLDNPPTSSLSVAVDPSKPPVSLSMTTVNASSMIVTMEVPASVSGPASAAVNPRVLAVLNGDITLTGNTVQWRPVLSGLEIQELLFNLSGSQPRVRVTVKGNAVFSDQGTDRLFLDGAARGRPGLRSTDPQNPSLRSDLVFPTGSANRASDFESWFFLQFIPPQPALAAVTVTPSQLVGLGSAAGRVVLSSITPAAGATVTVASSNTAVATVSPASVIIAQNQSSGTFSVAASASAPVGASTVSISAAFNNVTVTTTFTVVVLAVSVSPGSISLLVGGTVQFTATVTGAAAGVSTAVTWSVQEAGGGTIASNGAYVAPNVAGTFTIIARSVADTTKSATATVVVRTKGKDKDKEKEGKEAVIEKAVLREKISAEVVKSPLTPIIRGGPLVTTVGTSVRFAAHAPAGPAPAATDAPQPPADMVPAQPAGEGHSFIQPNERPAVGIGVVPKS